MKKTTMFVAVVACLMFAMVSVSNAAITLTGSNSTTYPGTNPDPWSPGDLQVGDGGAGSMTIDGSSVVNSDYTVIGTGTGGTGVVTVSGTGSMWYGLEGLSMGGDSTLDLLDGGLFKTDNTVSNSNIGTGSEIRMNTGGQLAIQGASTTSLDAFLAEIGAAGNVLVLFAPDTWASVLFDTGGEYHTLEAGTGDLDGYAVLTAIPEPATMSLLAIGGLALIRRRKRA